MATFENFRKHWSWAFIAFILSTSVAIGALYFQYVSARHDEGGTLNATFHSHYLNNREARTIVVCMEDTSVNLSNLYVTPTFDNSSEYSLKDFSLSFDAECTNVVLVPSSFVEAHEYGNNEQIFKYKENVLAAHDDTKKPFSNFLLNSDQGRCYIKTKASHDGAKSAFEYSTDVWFFVVPNKSHLTYENWKINCKKRLFEYVSDQYYDVYYFSRDHETEYQFDVALHGNNKAKETPAKEPSLASSSQGEQSKKIPAAEIQPAKQNVESSQTESVIVSAPDAESDDHQELHLAQYTTELKGDAFYLRLKYNKPPTEDASYLLYGHYTTPESEELHEIAASINVTVGVDWDAVIYKSNVKYDFKDDLRIIKQSNTDDFVELSQSGESTKITNKSDNDVVVAMYTSQYTYTTHTLFPGEAYYTNANKIIKVFDTGVKRNKEDIPLLDRYNSYFTNMGFWSAVIYVICFFGYTIICFLIILFFSEWKERGSFSEAWHEITHEFTFDEIRKTFTSDEDSLLTKIWMAFCYFTPIFAIAFTIYFILSL